MDDQVTEATEATEEIAEAPEEAKPKKEKPAPMPKSNGVSMPKEGTKTRRVWDIADEISREHARPALRGEVMDKAREENIVDGTSATQYGRWARFHGLDREQLKAARDAKTAADAPAEAPEGQVDEAPAEGQEAPEQEQ